MVGSSEDGLELRKLLRSLRGERRQRDIARAAGISTSLYKNLESGRSRMTSLDKLLRIAGALQSGTRDRARLLWLARPDLAEVLASRQAGMSPGLTLEAVRHLTKRLLDADNRVAAFRVAAESLYAAIEPQSIAFVLMQAESGDLLPVITIGQTTRVADGLRSLPVTAMAATQGASNDNLTIRYVPVTVARNERLYLGIAYDANARFDSCCDLLLETLAAALEVRLRKKGHPHLE